MHAGEAGELGGWFCGAGRRLSPSKGHTESDVIMVAAWETGDMVRHLSLSHPFGSVSLSLATRTSLPTGGKAALALLLCGQQSDSGKNRLGIQFCVPSPPPLSPLPYFPSSLPLSFSLLPSLPHPSPLSLSFLSPF